jgi:HD-like signal output (HDOD) protein/ActR/RegA family two-component response regulator
MGTDETNKEPETRARILFVDDEPLVLRSLKRAVSAAGDRFVSEFLESGSLALERLQEGGIDVVVSDMQMPVMDGAEFLSRIQDKHPEVVRIVLSGHADPRQAFRAVPVAHQFLTKPFEAQKLVRTLERAIELSALIGSVELRQMVARDHRLPAAPKTYTALTRLLARDDSPMGEIVGVIEKNPALSARVAQLASSGCFRVPRGVTTISGYLAYLGIDVIKSLVLSVELATTFDASGAGFSIDAIERHSLAVGNLARRMVTKREQAEDAFIAGLLHDVGRLVLASRGPREYALAVREAGAEGGRKVCAAEHEIFGATHAQVGGYLLGIWGLPLEIVDAVLCHHDPNRIAWDSVDVPAAVYLSNVLSHNPDAPITSGETEGLDGALLERLPESPVNLSQWRTSAHELLSHSSSPG